MPSPEIKLHKTELPPEEVEKRKARPKKTRRSQEMAEIVTSHPDFDPRQLEGLTTEQTREKFNEISWQILADIEIALHGMEKWDKETGKQGLAERGDVDGEAALGLFKMALQKSGLKPKSIEYVPKGRHAPGKMNIDTGMKRGLIIEVEKDPSGKIIKVTIYFDHHHSELDTPTSATQLKYEALTSSGLLDREPHLDEMVRFVTQVDNLSYPQTYFKKYPQYHHMLLGLWSHLKFKHLLEFFRNGKKPTDLLTDEEIKKYDLKKTSEAQKRNIPKSLEVLKEMERDGLIVETEKYGRIAIDMRKRVPGGTIAAKYYGCDGYII